MYFSIGLFASFLALVSATDKTPGAQSHEGETQELIAKSQNFGNKTIFSHRTKRGVGNDKCDGCYRGQCWSYCDNGIYLGSPWCYGSPTRSQDFNYQKCDTDADCRGNQCWYCAGSCTA